MKFGSIEFSAKFFFVFRVLWKFLIIIQQSSLGIWPADKGSTGSLVLCLLNITISYNFSLVSFRGAPLQYSQIVGSYLDTVWFKNGRYNFLTTCERIYVERRSLDLYLPLQMPNE